MTDRRLAYLCLETPREGQASHTHVHEIVAGLRRRGWDVTLFTTAGGGASSGSSLLYRFIEQLRLQYRLRAELGRFDAVFVRSHFMALPIVWSAARRNLPAVHEVNGKPEDLVVTYRALRPLRKLFEASYRSQYVRASRIVAVTDGLAEWSKTFSGHDRVSVIPNGANTELFKPDGPRISEYGRYVVFVGGLVAWHGVSTMLRALDDPAWPDGVKLVIAGDGVEREAVRRLEGHQRLLWLERQPYEKIPQILRGAICALCMIEDPAGRSKTGVAPLKLFEALACGVPVIASELPFQADLVRQEDVGIVVPMADSATLAKAVATLAAEPERARSMGQRGARYVVEHASWQARADATGRILAEAIDGH